MLGRLAATASALFLVLAGCSSTAPEAPKARSAESAGTTRTDAAPDITPIDEIRPPIRESSERRSGGPSSAFDAETAAPGRSAGATSHGTGATKDYVGPR